MFLFWSAESVMNLSSKVAQKQEIDQRPQRRISLSQNSSLTRILSQTRFFHHVCFVILRLFAISPRFLGCRNVLHATRKVHTGEKSWWGQRTYCFNFLSRRIWALLPHCNVPLRTKREIYSQVFILSSKICFTIKSSWARHEFYSQSNVKLSVNISFHSFSHSPSESGNWL